MKNKKIRDLVKEIKAIRKEEEDLRKRVGLIENSYFRKKLEENLGNLKETRRMKEKLIREFIEMDP